jgi:outer membrane protein assembly factor BamB
MFQNPQMSSRSQNGSISLLIYSRMGVLIALLTSISGCGGAGGSNPPPPSAWSTVYGDNANRGRSSGAGAVGRIFSSLNLGEAVQPVSCVDANSILYLRLFDKVEAATPTGSIIWSFTVYPRSSGPVLGNGMLYTGNDLSVSAFQASSGELVWSHDGHGLPYIGLDGTVYSGSSGNTIYALNDANGRERWTCSIPGAGGPIGIVGISPSGLVFANVATGSVNALYAIDMASHTVKWSVTNTGGSSYPIIGQDGTIYLTTGPDTLSALNGLTGSVKLNFPR